MHEDLVRLGYLQADELQVQNHPAYLSLRSDDNNENGNLPTVSDFASNFMTLLGLSADQVRLPIRKEKSSNILLSLSACWI